MITHRLVVLRGGLMGRPLLNSVRLMADDAYTLNFFFYKNLDLDHINNCSVCL